MSTDASLQTILAALHDLKSEVAGLTSSLHSAHERIARLERATFTPSRGSSPSPSTQEDAEDLPIINDCQERSSKASTDHGTIAISLSRTDEKEVAKEDNSPSDIHRHLQPLSDSLATLTIQLTRIEQAIDRPSCGNHCAQIKQYRCFHSTCNAHIAQQTQLMSQHEAKEPHSPLKDRLEDTKRTPKLPNSLTIHGYLAPSTQTIRPVFGRPSTPSQRIVSFDITGSPFGNYSDEQSPFSKLGTNSVGSGSVLHTQSSTFPTRFSGLSSNFQSAFGVADTRRWAKIGL